MKNGFYLSPCGNHIVQIVEADVTQGQKHIVFKPIARGYWFYLNTEKVQIAFSCWHYLGK